MAAASPSYLGGVHGCAEGKPRGRAKMGLLNEAKTAVACMLRLLSTARIEFAFNSSFCGKDIGRSSSIVAV